MRDQTGSLGHAGRVGDGCHRLAVADLVATARLWRLCVALAWHDLRLHYHGSVLGPFWTTLSTAIAVMALGGLYASLLRHPQDGYMPYLAVSLVGWNAMAGLLTEACQVFAQQAGAIRGLRMPFGVHAARLLLRVLFSAAHAALVLPPVFLLCGRAPSFAWLLLVPAFLLWVITGLFVVLGLGAACARFRDIPPAVAGALQLGLLVTPVLWHADLLGAGAAWLLASPLYTMLEVVRGPLLGQVPPLPVWGAAGLAAAVLSAGAWCAFARARGHLAMWV